MKIRLSLFVDAFLGSGVPVAGDPITSFGNVSLLGLRTATVLDNCYPMAGDLVKVRFLATNCGERRIEMVFPFQGVPESSRKPSEEKVTALLPGESLEYPVFRSWDDPGEYQLALVYEARCGGLPFARLETPMVRVHVRAAEAGELMHWVWRDRLAHAHVR